MKLKPLVTAVLLVIAAPAAAQDESTEAAGPDVEEVVVLGRFLSAAQQLQSERMDDDSVVDVLDADSISRLGDSTVASALRRVTGLSLVAGKFVYVRGLGERYSATTLNGATIPSPDLTRNVIPLDIFPASVVSGLVVRKSFAPDIIANFAGGLIDIRTTAFNDEGFNWSLEAGFGGNTEVDGDVFGYSGGGDDDYGTDDGTRELSAALLNGMNEYQASISAASILDNLRRGGDAGATFADAEAINRRLALALNRNVEIRRESSDPDMNMRGSIGQTFFASEALEIGAQLTASYDRVTRQTVQRTYNFEQPGEIFGTETETTHLVNMNGLATLGARYTDDHEVSASVIYLRDTDDEVAVLDYFPAENPRSDGRGFRDSRVEFEEREMGIIQFRGAHRLGYDTRETLNRFRIFNFLPEETEVKWFYSDATSETGIPNRVIVSSDTVTDAATGAVQSASIRQDVSAADFRFTDLEDEVLSYGSTVNLPFIFDNATVDVTFGYQYGRKARVYQQREFGLGSANAASTLLAGSVGQVFSDVAITNPANGFQLRVQGGARSYIAATLSSGYFGMIDTLLNDTWRFTIGARQEDYSQVALPWNVYGYNADSPQLSTDPAELEEASFQDDDVYPSITVAYLGEWWAEEFQLRVSWSETAIRPDLREVTEASYVDPISGELVFGNSGVRPSQVENFDIRADWFFANDNSFTVSFFSKTIDNPIEFFETPASDTNRARSIINAESTEIDGIEIEGLIRLSMLGDWGEAFFIQGNATIQNAETVAGPRADAPTNDKREATGASEFIGNLMLGFDSNDGAHTASLIYNVFGERLYSAGRLGAPDEFEQPFNSLDFTYTWYPMDTLTLKAKLQNVLNESVEIEGGGVVVFREDPGTSLSFRLKYAF